MSIDATTYALRDTALDLFEIWMEQPHRKIEFGPPELMDIQEAINALTSLALEIEGFRAIAQKEVA